MAETATRNLPILPLPSGVVLPGMVVTIGLESDEARAAIDAAGSDRTLVLVPKLADRFARVGVIARIEDDDDLPDSVRNELRVHPVAHVREALAIALTDAVSDADANANASAGASSDGDAAAA